MRKLLSLALALCMVFTLAACGSEPAATESEAPEIDPKEAAEAVIVSLTVPDGIDPAAVQGVEDGVLTVAMECAYAPYNWTQIDDSNGGVAISNMSSNSYANGYDVMISQIICDIYGWELEVVSSAWDSLVPGVQSGIYDAVIAGQSMTADRMEQVDMAGPYYYADIVVVTTKDSEYADATSIADLARRHRHRAERHHLVRLLPAPDPRRGPHRPGRDRSEHDNGPHHRSGRLHLHRRPHRHRRCAEGPNLVILNFAGTEGDFQFATEEERAENVNIGISVQKGNTTLLEAMDAVLSQMDADDFNAIMAYAISVQPEI